MTHPELLKNEKTMFLPALLLASGQQESRQEHRFFIFQKFGMSHYHD